MKSLVRHAMYHSATLMLATLLVAGSAQADQPSDGWITTKVKISLLSDDLVDGLDIDVDTVDGAVTLQGKVASEREKSRAEERASAIEGVSKVENMLAIVEPQNAEAVERADDELQQEVATVLERDSALADSDIEIASVNKGIVVLRGEASSLDAHRRALEDVRAVKGVERVSSEIQAPDRELPDVAATQPAEPRTDSPAAAAEDTSGSDTAISNTWTTTKVKMRLLSEVGISPFAINVDASDGVVTLFGIVESDVAMKKAGSEAAKVDGVREVQNELQVVPEAAAELQKRTDEAIYDTVRTRLDSKNELGDADIDVEVNNNVVRLTGTVKTRDQHERALELAKDASGVDSVIDDLEVEPNEAS